MTVADSHLLYAIKRKQIHLKKGEVWNKASFLQKFWELVMHSGPLWIASMQAIRLKIGIFGWFLSLLQVAGLGRSLWNSGLLFDHWFHGRMVLLVGFLKIRNTALLKIGSNWERGSLKRLGGVWYGVLKLAILNRPQTMDERMRNWGDLNCLLNVSFGGRKMKVQTICSLLVSSQTRCGKVF